MTKLISEIAHAPSICRPPSTLVDCWSRLLEIELLLIPARFLLWTQITQHVPLLPLIKHDVWLESMRTELVGRGGKALIRLVHTRTDVPNYSAQLRQRQRQRQRQTDIESLQMSGGQWQPAVGFRVRSDKRHELSSLSFLGLGLVTAVDTVSWTCPPPSPPVKGSHRCPSECRIIVMLTV